VLGGGTSGIVGLWEYIGPIVAPPAVAPPDFVVVKQVIPDNEYELNVESQLMERIMRSTAPNGTEHVVKLYKSAYSDPGGGTSDPDPSPYGGDGAHDPAKDVCRIYMEYVQGGDLENKLKKLPRRQAWLEEDLWRLMGCLARALVILECGTENPQAPAVNWRQIAHFDLKPANSKCYNIRSTISHISQCSHYKLTHPRTVLVGEYTQGQGCNHRRLRSFKVSASRRSSVVLNNPAKRLC
jgi:serine/threonine protein kinase